MRTDAVGFLPTACAGCGLPGPVWCARCDASIREPGTLPPHVRSTVALGRYEGPLRSAVAALKFRGATSIAAVLGRRLAGAVAEACDHGGFDCVAAIPTTPSRRHRRGFDQAELLAAAVAAGLRLPVVSLLWRSPGTAPQQALDRSGRLGPQAHRYLLEVMPPRRVLLVDDVVTTGATLLSALRLLSAHGSAATACVVAATPAGRI